MYAHSFHDMYVCMYICMYVCIYTHMNMHLCFAHAYIFTYILQSQRSGGVRENRQILRDGGHDRPELRQDYAQGGLFVHVC